MCGGGAPDPDPNVGLAALQTSQLGRDALNWTKDYTERVITPLQQQQADLAQRQGEQAIRIADANEGRASETYQLWKDNYAPLEESLAKRAMEFNSSDYADRKVAESDANVNQAFAVADAQQRQDLARRGIDMSSGQSLAAGRNSALAAAAARATGATTARDTADGLGFARQLAAAQNGRGLPSAATSQDGTALQAGQTATGAMSSALSGAVQGGSLVSGGYGQAVGGSQAGGNLWAQSSQQRISGATANAANDQQMIGAGIGAIGTIAAVAL